MKGRKGGGLQDEETGIPPSPSSTSAPPLPQVLFMQLLPPTACIQRSSAHCHWLKEGGGRGGCKIEEWCFFAHCALGDWKGEAADWFSRKAPSASAVLLRPDGLIFGVYCQGEEENLRAGISCAWGTRLPSAPPPQVSSCGRGWWLGGRHRAFLCAAFFFIAIACAYFYP